MTGPGLLRAVPVRRLTGFLGLPLISAVAPFLVLPALLHYVGTAAWAAIAIGQSIGTGASTFVQIGWPVAGPALVAEDPAGRRSLYTRSLVSRLTVFCLAAPAAMAISAALAPAGQRPSAALMAMASATLGLSASWFFVGTGQPGNIARFDTVPRVVATAVAALLVAWLAQAWLYPAVLIASSAVFVVAVSARYWERGHTFSPLRTTRDVVRSQWAAAGVSVQASLNAALPMTILATVAPGAVAGFAALDRITKFMTFVLNPVGLAFQGWVAEPGPDAERRRRTAFIVTVGAGVLLAAGFLVFADLLLRILFAGQIEVPYLAVVFASFSVLGVALGTTLGFHHLVPLRMSSWMALSTAVGIVVGSLGVLLLAPPYGVTGAALSFTLAEAGVVATQAGALAGRRFRRRQAPAPA